MPWARLDDGFHDHPKVDGLSLAAVGLWSLCLTWAHRHRRTALRPGHITEARVGKLAGKQATRLASELSAARLWEPQDDIGGWVIHDFADYLPRQRDPDEAAASGRKGAQAKWANQGKPLANSQQAASNELGDSMAVDGSRASAGASPSRPDPKEPEQQLGGERRETLRAVPATDHPQEIATPSDARCTAHHGVADPGPCAGCRSARERAERKAARVNDQAEQQRLAALRACPDCGGTGWLEHPDTGLPAGRCKRHDRRAS